MSEFKPVTIDGETAKGMYETICWAHEQYADEDRYDWFDVDDKLQCLAWELEKVIEKAQGLRDANGMKVFKIERCGDCKCMDHTGFCMARHEQSDGWCRACGWAESFSGDAVTVAKHIWDELGYVTVEEDGDTLDRDWENPILGWYFAHEADRLEIWHDIEEKTGISVAYLMGEAKNPDGTN